MAVIHSLDGRDSAMKNYGIDRMRCKEQLLFSFVRAKYSVLKHLTRSKKKKELYTYYYSNRFRRGKRHSDSSFAVPHGKHCIPVCLLTSDLILRDNLPTLKSGLVRLLRELSTHKYLTISRSIDDVLESIETMDDTLTWSFQSTRIGLFDFEPHKDLASKISHFELSINQVNPSYLAVETRICFTPAYTKFLQDLIDSDIKEHKVYVSYGFVRDRKKSGGKRT